MMLHRSASTQRSRGSRSPVNSGHVSINPGPKGRRASVAIMSMQPGPERQRSPRGSIVPNIAFDTQSDGPVETYDKGRVDQDHYAPSPDTIRSTRSILKPTDYCYSPRNSLVPPTNLPQFDSDMLYHQRNSLGPPTGSKTSLIPDVPRSPRGSITNLDRNHCSLICPDISKSEIQIGPVKPENNHSPRGSIAPDPSRSPRGSICTVNNRSPQGSIISCTPRHRSSRGSIGFNEVDGYSRPSITGNTEDDIRSPPNNIGPEAVDRSPRCSYSAGHERRLTKESLLLQEFHRTSGEHGSPQNRCASPYRLRDGNSGSIRSASSTIQPNGGYGSNPFADSRRASSSVSQVSGDESRRLYPSDATAAEKAYRETVNLRVATYGSVVFQLKDAHLEAKNTCDFVFRVLKVVSRTMVVTALLSILSIMPLLMLIFGVEYSNNCTAEVNIPTYLVVGGICGLAYMGLLLYSQIRSMRPEVVAVPTARKRLSSMTVICLLMSLFLFIWFILGNYWILRIKWPKFTLPLYDPEEWCEGKLYIFSIVHLYVMYVILGGVVFIPLSLAVYRIISCTFYET